MTHYLKLKQEFVDAVASGEKSFEIRFNDRGYQKGDRVIFNSIDKYGIIDSNSAVTEREYEITYVLNGFGLEAGYVVFGIEEIESRLK